MEKRVAVITGGSRGIGRATVDMLIKEGYTVYEMSRKGDDNVVHITCDVSDVESVKKAFNEFRKFETRLDVLICNAGFGISGAVEFTDIKDAKSQFDVNFFGSFATIQQALPIMREQRSGNIIVTSSVAAVVAIPYQSFYSCTKVAINAMCQALANEVRPFGINVAAVMPGDIKTDFTEKRKKSMVGSDVYLSMEKSVAVMEKDEENGMPPESVARIIVKLAGKKKLKPLYTVGGKYKLVVFLVKLLPVGLYNKIVGKMYS